MSQSTSGLDGEHHSSLVSIVITCFNYAEFLGEAIDSALGQTYRTVEVIVVNDGSTDSTDAVATKYAHSIQYHCQENAGVSAARNAGISIARGDFVVCLDADDTLASDFVEKCVSLLQAHPEAGFVYTPLMLFGRENGVSARPQYELAQLKRTNFIHASALLRATVLKTHLYEESVPEAEDWNLYLTLAEHGIHGILLDEPLLNYRKHADRISRLDSLTYRGRRTRLRIVRAHPDLYTSWEKLSATIKAAVEPFRVTAGRLKGRLKGALACRSRRNAPLSKTR